ncbi:WD repeat-containing protein 55 [Corythoichthys intestinalis]|uniref:WD repeat-containing protein 55 n=1 Tax=Corythoichthys intestinalis TaxID=161448 RepID=UPI0025A5BD3F|nr:WD repeat-containing protein 55 [Corythoichthys intestinalis]XP_061810840.1 WD repeat-containing protein 55-like [Nerophis lumbriciformis]
MAASMEHADIPSTSQTDANGDLASSDSVSEDEAAEPRILDAPQDIHLEAVANTVAVHPSRDMLVCGDVDGDVYAFSYSCTEGENRELWSSGHHLKSCRQVRFSQDGEKLFSVSRDKAVHVLDVERGRLVTRIRGAHGVPINSLLLVDSNIVATGDDGGTLKLWDMRKGTAFMDLKHHDDYISDIAVDEAKKILLTTSGDGTMGVFNIKRRRFELLSEYQSGDLTSVTLMKRGKKVVCGSCEGTIYIFNWNGFGATSDRFALRAESVDCMVPINDNILCAASMDGYIRAINILPNRVIGCIGQHVGEPVEELAKSWDSRFLVSCAHDQRIKFWDISSLASTTVDEYRKRKKKDGGMKSLSKKALGDSDFFSGLVEEPQKTEDGEKDEEHEEGEDSDSDSGSD